MFEQNRNAELHIISSPNIIPGVFTAAADVKTSMKENQIPGITDFGYDHQLGVEIRGKGQFGKNRPVGITDEYGGIKGSFDAEGVEGETAILAAINKMNRATFITSNYNKLQEFFIIANVTTDDGAPLASHFCMNCKVDGVPKKISGDAKRFSFQGIYARDFRGHLLHYHVVDGNATPVTAANYPTTEVPIAWADYDGTQRYAVAVLLYDDATKGVTEMSLATAAAKGFYSETDSAVTLHADNGLKANDKLVVVYLV